MPRAALLIVLISCWLAGPSAAGEPVDMPPDGTLGVLVIPRASFQAEQAEAELASSVVETTGSLARPSASPISSPPADDLLCTHAPKGSLAPVPSPFDRWLVVVCAASGQALVPVEGSVWYAHGSREPISILAFPPSASTEGETGPSAGPGPRYDIRFKAFYAVEATEERRLVAMRRLKLALGGAPMPLADHIYQIDAVSSVAGLRYNIFFYLRGAQPRMALACLDQCTRALLIDIGTTASDMNAGLAP